MHNLKEINYIVNYIHFMLNLEIKKNKLQFISEARLKLLLDGNIKSIHFNFGRLYTESFIDSVTNNIHKGITIEIFQSFLKRAINKSVTMRINFYFNEKGNFIFIINRLINLKIEENIYISLRDFFLNLVLGVQKSEAASFDFNQYKLLNIIKY